MMTISDEVYEHIRTYTIYSRFSQHSMYCRFLVGFNVFFFILSFIIPAKTGKMSSFFMSSFRNERKIRVTAFFLLWRVIFFLPSLLIYSKCSCGPVAWTAWANNTQRLIFFTLVWASFLLSDNACLRRSLSSSSSSSSSYELLYVPVECIWWWTGGLYYRTAIIINLYSGAVFNSHICTDEILLL